MPKHSSPPSAHDVARVAGVSQAAVSRAFTPGASIAEATQNKVFRAAKSLGYRPNLIASSLNKGKSGIVGVIFGGNPRNPFFLSALYALLARLSRAGKHILIFTVDSNANADVHAENLLKYRVDALLLMATSLSAKLAEQCHDEGVPILFFNRRPPRVKVFSSVAENNSEGGREIAEHLLQQGYKRLAVVAGSAESSTARERESGFTAYLTSRGLAAPEREVGHFHREGAVQAARNLLSRKPRPDAIFCVNDYMALAAIEVARYEFGLEIGREIGIAGFDDIDEASWPSFELTTYSVSMESIIDGVAAFLLNTPRQKNPLHTVIDGVLKPRRSTQRK
jgi:DNA-binding LacI/PurR family transcriptional regulator